MEIPYHEAIVERVHPRLHPTGHVYAGAIRYGDVFQAAKGLRWWVFDVSRSGEILLRNDRLTTPQVCRVTELQLRTSFRLADPKVGGRVAIGVGLAAQGVAQA